MALRWTVDENLPRSRSVTPVTTRETIRRTQLETTYTTPCSQETSPAPPPPGDSSAFITPPSSPGGQKQLFQDLNDRLADVIDKLRQEEARKKGRKGQVSDQLCQQELTAARQLLDEIAKEKAALQIDCGKFKASIEELERKLSKKDQDLEKAKSNLLEAENEVENLNGKLKKEENEHKKLTLQLKEVQEEFAHVSDQLKQAKKQLENETLMRVDLQNQLQSKKEEMELKQKMYEQHSMYEQQLEEKLKVQYEAQLQRKLQELREDFEQQLNTTRKEYENKIDDLTRDNEMVTKRSDDLNSNLWQAKSRITALESKSKSLEGQVSDLEAQLKSERLANANLKRKLLSQEGLEIQDRVTLTMELAAYMKLLEAEEERLEITPRPGSARKRTPRRQLTPSRQIKRRKIIQESSNEMSGFRSTARAFRVIEFLEDCPEGKFVKLRNTGDQDFPMGGYSVLRRAGHESNTYMFNANAVIPAGATVTIYSSDVGETDDPQDPLNIVITMDQSWAVADDMTTRIFSPNNEELAVIETKRNRESFTSVRMGEQPDQNEDEQGGSRGSTPSASQLYMGCTIC